MLRYSQEPHISYDAVQHIKSRLKDSYNYLHLTCFNLQIRHEMIKRDKVTKEPVLYPSMCLEELNSHFETSIPNWDASEPCNQLKSVLRSANLPSNIEKIIGFACGLVALYDRGQSNASSAFQHALLLTVRDLIRDKTGKDIPCYVQDPANTDIDKSGLERLGIQVLDDPCGFLEVDDSSVVCSFAPNVPVKQIVMDIARPAVLVWDRVQKGVEGETIEGCPQ